MTYVVAGTVVQTVDWEKRLLAGNVAFVAAGIVRAAFNVGQNDARFLVAFSPCIGDGFEAVDVSSEAPRMSPGASAARGVRLSLFSAALMDAEGFIPAVRLYAGPPPTDRNPPAAGRAAGPLD